MFQELHALQELTQIHPLMDANHHALILLNLEIQIIIYVFRDALNLLKNILMSVIVFLHVLVEDMQIGKMLENVAYLVVGHLLLYLVIKQAINVYYQKIVLIIIMQTIILYFVLALAQGLYLMEIVFLSNAY